MSQTKERADFKTRFKTDREESCTAQINVRIPPSLKQKLKGVDNWQEEVRIFLSELIEASA